ncbi:putativelike family protein [Phaeomoniella chlamydospora]|uniref:Putativelike family protein n=1 Tax=Phaeomoniella chlamydospora TaxID=158046 RepID=A0A0G2GNS1_PHACM|nr:putativelike family protein [Phaeomoniella chlamydospora]
MVPSRILVIGATGKQGGAAIDALLSSPNTSSLEIYAVTRNVDSPSAQKLSSKSPQIKLVKGDLDDATAIFKEINQPIDAVFAMTALTMKKDASEVEVRQGKAIVDAAVANKVKHFVFTSVDRHGEKSDNDPTYVPHFASKHEVEQHLKAEAHASGMTWTILRPVAFLDNLEPGFFGKIMATWWYSLGDTKLQMVSVKDIGVFAAKALLQPDAYQNRSISLAGEEMTFEEANAVYMKLYNRPMPTTFVLLAKFLGWMVADMGWMLKFFKEEHFAADIKECREINPGMQDLETWLKESSQHHS